jgi:DNA repair ATPase RecN
MKMSTVPVVVTPAAVQAAAVPAAPAKPLTAIERIEAEIAGWVKQHEQAVANVHAVEGAIQGGQRLLAMLKAEEAKAIAEAKKVGADITAEAQKIETSVKAEAEKVETTVESELKKI